MKTMTTLIGAGRTPSGAFYIEVLGNEKVGTTDEALGSKALAIFDEHPEHCMCEIEYEVKGERLYLTGIEYIEAPEELGGPPETPTGAASTAEQPDLTLDDLMTLAQRVQNLEVWAIGQGFKL